MMTIDMVTDLNPRTPPATSYLIATKIANCSHRVSRDRIRKRATASGHARAGRETSHHSVRRKRPSGPNASACLQ